MSTWATTLSEHLDAVFVYAPEHGIYPGSLCHNTDNSVSLDCYGSHAGADIGCACE